MKIVYHREQMARKIAPYVSVEDLRASEMGSVGELVNHFISGALIRSIKGRSLRSHRQYDENLEQAMLAYDSELQWALDQSDQADVIRSEAMFNLAGVFFNEFGRDFLFLVKDELVPVNVVDIGHVTVVTYEEI